MYDTTVGAEEVQSAEMLLFWGDTWDFVRVPTKGNSRMTCGILLKIKKIRFGPACHGIVTC